MTIVKYFYFKVKVVTRATQRIICHCVVSPSRLVIQTKKIENLRSKTVIPYRLRIRLNNKSILLRSSKRFHVFQC